ncbi:MAM and LDL-receptor class A domain-containing protein 1-like isoform X2 [Ciona intestinalis]
MYIEASTSGLTSGDKAQIVFTSQPYSTQDSCLTFWYHAYGEALGGLNVFVEQQGSQLTSPIWRVNSNQGNRWFRADVSIQSGNPSLLWETTFEGVYGTSFYGDVAIDDVTFSSFPCLPSGSCDFEHDWCDWVSDPALDLEWVRASQTTSLNPGPAFDHTNETATGMFLYISPQGQQKGDFARVTSYLIPATSPDTNICLSFWYYISGSNIGSLDILQRSSSNMMDEKGSRVWRIEGDHGDQWIHGQVSFNSTTTDFRIDIEAVLSIGDQGAIALDDVQVTQENCEVLPSEALQTRDGPFLLYSNNFPTYAVDVNDDDEALIVNNAGHRFFLVSPGLSGTSGSISFESEVYPHYYLRHQNYILYLHKYDTTDLYRQDSSFIPHGDKFYKGYTAYESVNYRNLYIRHKNSNLMISEDDGTDLLHQDASFLPTKNLGPFECDFEIGLCGWVNRREGDDTDWTRHTGATDTENTGPSGDHTHGNVCWNKLDNINLIQDLVSDPTFNDPPNVWNFGRFSDTEVDKCELECSIQPLCAAYTFVTNDATNGEYAGYCYGRASTPDIQSKEMNHISGRRVQCQSGYYMYLQSSPPNVPGDTAQFFSSPLNTDGAQCVSFWYHMHGSDTGILSMLLSTEEAQTNPLWSRHGPQGRWWVGATVKVKSDVNYKVAFESVVGSGQKSDIALDDIAMTSGQCPEVAGFCDFENSQLCGWTKDDSSDFLWTWDSGGTSSTNTGPSYDHTYQTEQGHYIFIEASSPRVSGDVARMFSPTFVGSKESKCMKFYYHMFGTSIGSLSIYLAHGLQMGLPLWYRDSNQGDQWLLGQTTISSAKDYEVVIAGSIGSSYYGDISIDDITITDGACSEMCDFDHPTPCLWNNVLYDDDFDWTEEQGKITNELGPPVDHTTSSDTGYYLMADMSIRKPADVARFESETIPPSSPDFNCVYFYFYMTGASGNLSVYAESVNTGGRYLLWSLLVGNEPPVWNYAAANIAGDYHRRIVFEALVESSTGEALAIDDIVFSDIDCTTFPYNAANLNPITPPSENTTAPPPLITGSADCNFDINACNWASDDTYDLTWQRAQGPSIIDGTGPNQDHTSGNGYYMMLDSNSASDGDTALLVGPVYRTNGTSTTRCMTFWYHMFGYEMGKLAVNIKTKPHIGQPVWIRNGHQGNRWQHAAVEIKSSVDYQIVFAGTRADPESSVMAIDDVILYDGGCEQFETAIHSCDFQDPSICSFTQDNTDDFNWSRRKGATSSVNTGPTTDHTYQSDEGYYMYIEMSGRTHGDIARLISPLYALDQGTHCVQFYYHMLGKDIGSLILYQRADVKGDKDTWRWNLDGEQGPNWFLARVDVPSIYDYKIVFHAVGGNDYYGDIAIDDVTIIPNACPIPMTCDFETDLCDWTNVKWNDKFDWIEGRGIDGLGPQIDHMGSNQGYYLYVQYHNKMKAQDTAELWGQIINLSDGKPRCLRFWINIAGNNAGALRVIQRLANGKNYTQWIYSSDTSNTWINAAVPIDTSSQFKIVFQASMLGGSGHIAIDDIGWTSGTCAVYPTEAAPPPPTTEPSVPVNCTFEVNQCGWNDDDTADITWIRHSGSTTSSVTGPSSGYGGTGYYMYVESSSPTKTGDVARLLSSKQDAGSLDPKCLVFYYHMYGSTMGTMNVYIKYGSTLPTKPIWTNSGDAGNAWIYSAINFTPESNFQVAFEGVVGSSYTSDMAIDEISLYDGNCQPPTFPDTYICTFESDCQYTTQSTTSYKWNFVSGASSSGETGPNSDHTYKTSSGKYALAKGSSGTTAKQTTSLNTPVYNIAGSNVCVDFYYTMYGKDVGTLTVVQLDDKGIVVKNIWNKQGDQGRDWLPAQTGFTKTGSSFIVSFQIERGDSQLCDVAIDDVLVYEGLCVAGSCSFDVGPCTWVQVVTLDDFDWDWNQGTTPTTNTGPTTDHTSGGGKYMFIETSNPRLEGDRALLQSDQKLKTTGSGDCLSFFYHMYGSTIGTLNILVGDTNNNVVWWQLLGDQGQHWNEAQVTITSHTNYHIYFEAIVGKGVNGDIAIDDVQFTPGISCSRGIIYPLSALPIVFPTIPTTTPLPPIPGFQCDFESDLCGWVNSADDLFDWNRRSGDIGELNAGPIGDYTTGLSMLNYIKLIEHRP